MTVSSRVSSASSGSHNAAVSGTPWTKTAGTGAAYVDRNEPGAPANDAGDLRGCRRARRDVLGPAVVGLAARRADDPIDEVQLAGHLVAGDRLRQCSCSDSSVGCACRRAAAPPRRRADPSARRARRRRCSRTRRGGDFTAASTSSGKIFSPPELIDTEPRPSSVIVPSASTVAKSPGIEYRTPSASVTNVSARLRRVLVVLERDVARAGRPCRRRPSRPRRSRGSRRARRCP